MTEQQQAWPIDNIERLNKYAFRVTIKGFGHRNCTADELAAAGNTPPPDPIDFDALPNGTVIMTNDGTWTCVKWADRWYYLSSPREHLSDPENWTVVGVPAPPTKLDALHALGLTDDDIEQIVRCRGFATDAVAKIAVAADAAREARRG